jgi:hypothetical protein
MAKEPTLSEIVFGENNSDKMAELYFKKDVTKEEAQKVLESLRHPEMLTALKSLEHQIEINSDKIIYSRGANFEEIARDYGDLSKCLLLTDWSYRNGFIQAFGHLIEQANPNYKLEEEQPIAKIILQKNNTLS